MAIEYLKTAAENYHLRQELKILRRMNNSKQQELYLFIKLLKERADDLNSMYELWRDYYVNK